MNNNEENDLLDLGENYALPEKKEIVLDVENKKTVDLSSLSPMEMIQLTAKEQGIELKQFQSKYGRFDTNCRRPGCYGRGYKGWSGIVPIPCVCLFKPENRNDGRNLLTRKVNRDFDKYAKRQAKYDKENRAEIYGLKHHHKDIWISKNGTEFRWMNIKGKWDFRRADIVLNPVEVDLDDN